MDGTKLTKEQFLRDVESHYMEVLKDDGLYRHLKFSDGTFDRHFEIITFPGYLAIVGDMGEFVFQRTEDMFGFFRNRNGELAINTGYWGEKVVAESVFGGGIREFNVEDFKEAVIADVRAYLELEEDEGIPDDFIDDNSIDVLLHCEDEYDCTAMMRDYRSLDHPNLFQDFWEHNFDRKTFHYVWCCYAIAWAVIQYDKAKVQ